MWRHLKIYIYEFNSMIILVLVLIYGTMVVYAVLPKAAKLRCSLYADDAGVSLALRLPNYRCWHTFLTFFGRYSGLKFNLEKKGIYPINCPIEQVQALLFVFPGKLERGGNLTLLVSCDKVG
jgi:hypothetical protein